MRALKTSLLRISASHTEGRRRDYQLAPSRSCRPPAGKAEDASARLGLDPLTKFVICGKPFSVFKTWRALLDPSGISVLSCVRDCLPFAVTSTITQLGFRRFASGCTCSMSPSRVKLSVSRHRILRDLTALRTKNGDIGLFEVLVCSEV